MRVLIVDDDERVRNALCIYFDARDDFVLAGEAANGMEAIEQCRQLQPDVILLDLNMPYMDGVTATQRIRSEFPHLPVVILTNGLDMDPIDAALRAGASSYVFKSSNVDKLAEALRSTHRGQHRILHVPRSVLKLQTAF
jgi:DNA-binding NarL/FixJ family response regulator